LQASLSGLASGMEHRRHCHPLAPRMFFFNHRITPGYDTADLGAPVECWR